jgi:hypothetical protein
MLRAARRVPVAAKARRTELMRGFMAHHTSKMGADRLAESYFSVAVARCLSQELVIMRLYTDLGSRGKPRVTSDCEAIAGSLAYR